MEKILACRLETVPPGYSRTTFQQIEAADKRLFVLLAEKTRAGVKSGPDGRPCDKHCEACMNSTEVTALLQLKPLAVKRKDDEPPFKRLRTDNQVPTCSLRHQRKRQRKIKEQDLSIFSTWAAQGPHHKGTGYVFHITSRSAVPRFRINAVKRAYTFAR